MRALKKGVSMGPYYLLLCFTPRRLNAFLLAAAAFILGACITYGPAFMIHDTGLPNEKVAVFVSEVKMKEHHVTAEQYKEIICATFAVLADGLATVPYDGGASSETIARYKKALNDAGFTKDSKELKDLFKHTRIETWIINSDGTHKVKEVHKYKD